MCHKRSSSSEELEIAMCRDLQEATLRKKEGRVENRTVIHQNDKREKRILHDVQGSQMLDSGSSRNKSRMVKNRALRRPSEINKKSTV